MIRSQFISLLAVSPAVLAYGPVGHRTIAYLAEKWLSPDATRIFGELLVNDRSYDLSDAAVWADKARDQDWLTWHTSPWNYINPEDDPPKGICGVNWPKDCPEESCIIRAIMNQVCRVQFEP